MRNENDQLISLPVLDWRWWYALLGSLAISVSLVLPSFLPLPPGTAEIGLVPFVLFALFAVLIPRVFAGHVSATDLGLCFTSPARMAIVGLGLWALFMLAGMALEAGQPDQTPSEAEALRMAGLGQGARAELILIVMIGIFAPVGEEMIYRGLIYRALRDGLARYGRFVALVAALVLSSALFVQAHLTSGPNLQILQYALFAVVMALAYEFSGSLLTAIGAHALNNMVVLVMMLGSMGATLTAPWLYAVVCAAPVIATGLGWAVGRLLAR